jgi:hypothetical protein
VTLNKREQLIAWVLGAVLGLGVLYYAGMTWWDARLDLDKKTQKLRSQLNEENDLIERAKKVDTQLAALQIQRIDPNRPDPARTDALVRNTYYNAGLTITGWTAAGLRSTAGTRDFQESKYSATATTTTARLARFLQTIESAHIPARIDSITITTPKQGQDNLHIELTISALLYAPKTTTTAAAAGAASRLTTARGPETARTANATATAPGRGAVALSTTKAGPTAEEQSKLIEEMMKRRKAEEERLATAPATPPAEAGPKKTAEEIEAEMAAKRLKELGAAESQPATTTTSPGPTGGIQ